MTTLLQLRTRCKSESDNVNQSFISDPEWLDFINTAYGEVYALLAEAFGARYFVQTPNTGYTLVTNGIDQQYPLPSDLYKLLNVSVQVSSPQQWVSLKPFQMADLNTVAMFNTQIPAAGQTVRLFYVPRFTPLVLDADIIADAVSINRWDELIVAKACIKALAKEESDVSVFTATESKMNLRLEAETENRDAGNPSRIQDVIGKRARSMQYALFGSNLYIIGGATPGWYYGVGTGDWGPYDDSAWGGF